MPRRATEFQTIRSEGGLLPPDLLRRIVDPASKVSGVEPAAYGLAAGERINEAITDSWKRLRRHWAEFRSATKDLPAGEAATGLTNDKWSLPLLRELGFGFLATTAGPTIDGKSYAISRFAGATPIHLVGCGVDLDRRAAGVRGAAAGNPHGLIQEFLNRSTDHLWAIVSNGLSFRILRDNQALSRQSFLEFDLEAMFDGEVYSDFVLLWLVAHASRFLPLKDGLPDSCWLETWSKEAAEQGVAALKDLRGSVEKALEILGQGFVGHPKNTALRDALRKGEVKLSDFHHQLLRIVYRLIFLFVAEDRELEGIPILHPQDKSDSARLARERFAAHYSTSRLRELASRIKGSRHGDLWRQFHLLVGAVSGDSRFSAMCDALALPVLGSMLWNPTATALLNGPGLGDPGAELSNHDFLEALRHLAFIRKHKILRPVDYKNLGSEEFGGVYESFLALTPQISSDGARFTFAEFAGNERKTSGSYYTPDSLVQCLLDSALDPVVEARLADAERLAKLEWASVEKEIQSDAAKRTYVLAFLTKHAGTSKTATSEERKRAWTSIAPAIRRWKLSEEGILALKVCDMACGSGHFLVGAGHRLARHLARVRALAAGESEPSPLLYQTALRDVIGHCLYGVDINPMAVELCKVTLWLEALEPGKPLSFLDHHIRCGNSLLGTTPELISAGLPDETFEAIEGDDKAACASLKKLNRAQREGLRHLFIAEDTAIRERMHQAAAAIDEISDSKPEDIHRKEAAFRSAQQNYDFQKAWDLANLWCAAFVIKKRFGGGALASGAATVPASSDPSNLNDQPSTIQTGLFGGTEELPKAKWKKAKAPSRASSEIPIGITTQHIRDFVAGGALPDGLLAEAKRLADQYQFFHFHLAFPEVFALGGFDVSLGNPPWEKINLKDEEFFASSHPHIAAAASKAVRKNLIERLKEEEPASYARYVAEKEMHDHTSVFFRFSGCYPLTGVSRINLYSVFCETGLRILAPRGRLGMVLASGIVTDDNNKSLFASLIEGGLLIHAWDFENSEGIFHGVHRSFKFLLLCAGGVQTKQQQGDFAFYLTDVADLKEPERHFTLSSVDLHLLNPVSGTCPAFRNRAEAELTKHIYRRVKAWAIHEKLADWPGSPKTPFNMSNDSGLFVEKSQMTDIVGRTNLPLYESKFIHQFNHRFGTFSGGEGDAIADFGLRELQNPNAQVESRYWLDAAKLAERFPARWFLVWRDITCATNERTSISAIVPNYPCAHTLSLVESVSAISAISLCAALNSQSYDYCARQKVTGTHLNHGIWKQLPLPSLSTFTASCVWSGGIQTLRDWLLPRVLELTYTAWDLEAFAQDCGWSGPPFRWDEERRFLLRCELDAAFFHLYLGTEDEWRKQPEALTKAFPTPRAAVSYIMDTFPIVKRKDEAKFNGDYRTKRVILEIYDALAEAIQSDKPYETRLAPIPASFRSVHMPRFPKDKRIALDSAEKFLVSFIYGFLHQTHAEATFDLLDSVFHLLRHRDLHADEFAAAIGDSAKTWLSSFNDKLPNKDFLPFLKRLEADGWITADRRTGHLSITEKFPAVPFDAWRNYDISAALRVIAQQPEVAKLVLAQPDTPLASREFQLQKTG